MVFPTLLRSARSAAVAVATGLLASMLVVAAAPAVASVASTIAVDPAFSGFADQLPVAVTHAAALAAQEPQPDDETAQVSGTIAFPQGSDTTQGRTFVVAYAPGTDVTAPLAAAAVPADGVYAMQAPIGEVILAVVSEGRAVLDDWGPLGVDITTAQVTALAAEGVVHDVVLEGAAAVTGSVTVPSGVVIAGEKIAVAVYPAGGGGIVATAANYVSDAGTFTVGGLPAGDYRVAFVSSAAGAASEWWKDAPSFAKAATINLAGSVSASLVATLEALRLMETSVPTVSGVPTVGQRLTAVPGAWTAGVTFGYQWYANGAAIAKATASSLVLPATLAGKKITVRVTGAKAAYTSVPLFSVATAAVVRPLSSPVPAITGTAIVGQTLKVKPGIWTVGTKLSYQWYINGVAVAKATGAAFKIPAAATLKTITVVVKGAKSGYASASKRSKATAAVKGILAAPTPRITGSTLVGSRLTAVPYTWTRGTTLKYQWYMNGKAISRATGSSLIVTAAMVKTRITVKITGVKSGYISAARISGKTGVVSYPSRTKPVSSWNCPSWAPIKGNASSMIYHVRSGAYYAKTKPEACFSTESAAVKAGYRKSKR